MSEDMIGSELRDTLDEIYRPAPGLLPASMAAVRSSRQQRSWAWGAGVAAIVLAACCIAFLFSIRLPLHPAAPPAARAPARSLPAPVPQPVTRTNPAAQIAWLSLQSPGQQPQLIGIDPSGHIVARLDRSTASGAAASYGFWRSSDGATIFTTRPDSVESYSALDGKPQRTYSRAPGEIVGDAFSPDGHWLALLLSSSDSLCLQVIDLQAGTSQTVSVSGRANSVASGLAVFGSDSAHLYTLTDWEGATRLSVFILSGDRLAQSATAAAGEGGRQFPSCPGPAMAARVAADGQTLVAFCHADGVVSFFDLRTLTSTGFVRPEQRNPFWLSPIFTPDGRLLYLHQANDTMQVVDLQTRRLLGAVPTPTRLEQPGPFAWLITDAYAGGVASTCPVSPDGLKLYAATWDGVMVLRVPDLKPLARLATDMRRGEVWVSGDGRTLFETSADGKRLVVMREDGSDERSVTLPGLTVGFIASEHG